MLKSGEVVAEDLGSFSRIVPFRGIVFKSFSENAVPSAVFSEVSQEDNLDGEGLAWGAARLAARPE